MTEANPYAAPQTGASLADGPSRVLAVGRAQKLLIYAILLNLVGTVIVFAAGPAGGMLALPINLFSLVLSIIGIIRLAIGLGNGIAMRVVYIVLMFVPLVNLITLVILNGKATKMLRDAGYKVGLLGANLSAAPTVEN